MDKIVLYSSCHMWHNVLPTIHAICHQAIVHIYKSNARHAVRFKIFGFRCEIYPHRSSCHFLQTGLPLSECNKTKPEEQCSISFSHGAFRYLVILHTQPCLTLYIYILEVCLKDPETFPALTWQSLTLAGHNRKVLIFPDASVAPVPSYALWRILIVSRCWLTGCWHNSCTIIVSYNNIMRRIRNTEEFYSIWKP